MEINRVDVPQEYSLAALPREMQPSEASNHSMPSLSRVRGHIAAFCGDTYDALLSIVTVGPRWSQSVTVKLPFSRLLLPSYRISEPTLLH